jgi:hypothetical protein
MSIEQKIAELLAESKKAQLAEQAQSDEVVAEEVVAEEEIKPAANTPNPDNAKNAVVDEKEAEGGTSKKANRATQSAAAGDQSVIRQGNTVKEDIDALMNGEELSEEFRAKATTIFEAAVMNRVKDEVARLEEEFESKLRQYFGALFGHHSTRCQIHGRCCASTFWMNKQFCIWFCSNHRFQVLTINSRMHMTLTHPDMHVGATGHVLRVCPQKLIWTKQDFFIWVY